MAKLCRNIQTFKKLYTKYQNLDVFETLGCVSTQPAHPVRTPTDIFLWSAPLDWSTDLDGHSQEP
jgi:hypothetical protein